MKKYFILIITALILLSLTACGEQQPSLPQPPASTESSSVAPSSTAKPTDPCANGHSFAEDSDICALCGANYYAETLEFTLNDTRDSYSLSGLGSCERNVLKVPETYKGCPVTAVASRAFYGARGTWRIKEVVLPDTITTIGESAFRECRALISIHLPQAVTEIGGYAFADCEALKSIHIPENVTVIEEGVFSQCLALETVTIAGPVSAIKQGAFGACWNLLEITIPESVTSIGRSAFSCCEKLTELHLPEGLVELGDSALSGCVSLETIRIPAAISSVHEMFMDCISLKSVTFAGQLERIGNSTFKDCTSLAEIIVPDTVNYIGHYAFSGCKSLRRIVLPTNVEFWGSNVFKNCNALECAVYEGGKYLPTADIEFAYFVGIVDLNQKELTLHDDAMGCIHGSFEGSQLHKLYIGKNIQYIEPYDFKNFSMLECIEVAQENEYFYSNSGCLIEISTKTLVRACKGATIPDDGSVTIVGRSAFAYLSGIRCVEIPDAIVSIDANAFMYCVDMEELIIGTGVQDIDHDQLNGCDLFSKIYYCGTQAQWEQIKIYGIGGGGIGIGVNTEIKNATIYYYSETPPTEPGNYWRYVNGIPTPWETEET